VVVMTAIRHQNAIGESCSICDDLGCVTLDGSNGYWATSCRFCDQGERIGVSLSLRGFAVWFGYDQSGVAA
jgi:hypothetical protein